MNRAARTAIKNAAGCTGKIVFRSWKHAARAASNQSKSHAGRLAPYQCPACHLFHVGNNGHGPDSGNGVDPRQRYIVFATGPDGRELLIGYSSEPGGGQVARRVIETAGWLVSRIVDRKPYLKPGATP